MSIDTASQGMPASQDADTSQQAPPAAPGTPTAAPAVSDGTPQSAPQVGPTPGVNGVRTPMQNAVDNTVQPPAPTAAEQKAVTLATKSPNPVAQHLHDVAETLSGGSRYTTSYDDQGNPTRHKVPVSTAHLGLALAMEVLRGGLAGISGDPREAAKRGMDEGKAQVAAQQKAQQDQNNQDNIDQQRKLETTQANLKLHQAAMNVGKQDEEMNRQLDATFAPVMNDLERNHPDAILTKVPEWALQDALKKYNITKEMAIPYDTIPVLDTKTGEQAKHADGSPVWGHMYAIVDPSIKTTLSDETQTMGYNVGEFHDSDGQRANIGTPGDWPLKDIIARHTKYAQIQVAEGLLNKQIAEMKGIAPDDKEGPKVSMADQVRNDPTLMSAVEDYSKYAGVGGLDQIIYTMGQSKDPVERQSAARIMQLAGISADDLEAKHNERIAAAKRATDKPIEPDTAEKARLIASNPSETPARRQLAQAVLNKQQQEEVDKETRTNQNKEALSEQKQNEKDKRTYVYAEDPQSGRLVYTTRYEAENTLKAPPSAIEEVKPSDVKKDGQAIRQLNDVQINTSRYTKAAQDYASGQPLTYQGKVVSPENPVAVSSTATGLFGGAKTITDAQAMRASDNTNLNTLMNKAGWGDINASISAGGHIEIPALTSFGESLSRGFKSKAYNELSDQGKAVYDGYVRTMSAIPAYQKALTQIGRSNKEMLDLELANIANPTMAAADIVRKQGQFQENVDRASEGFPKLPGLEHPRDIRAKYEQQQPKAVDFQIPQPLAKAVFRRNPQTQKVEKSSDGGATWQ